MTFQEKILKNKTGALYFASLVGALTVFFFILFSFGGKSVHAASIVDNSGDIVGTDTAGFEWKEGTYETLITATTTGLIISADLSENSGIPMSAGGIHLRQDDSVGTVCALIETQTTGAFIPFGIQEINIPFSILDASLWTPVPGFEYLEVRGAAYLDDCFIASGNDYWMEVFWYTTSVAEYSVDSIGRPYLILYDTYTPPVVESGVEIDSPVDSFVYPNNPITFSGTYTNQGTYDQLQIIIESNTAPISIVPSVISLPPLSVVDAPWNFSRNLPFLGAYTIRGRLWDSALATGTPFTSDIQFVLGTTATTSTSTQSNLPGDPTPIDCGTFDIGCYLKNAIVWAFWPDEQIITQFQNLTLRNTFPFAYAYEAVDMVQILANPDTMASTSISVHTPIGDLTFLNKEMLEAIPLSGTVKSAIEICTWILCVLYCYRRTLGAHDTNTTSS